ncbi:uncharacterized protein LOC126907152 [Daktulosphaira vitifoliae]|uniref:uncharacterized protein LOC126907152 n=1 Tax=Daktulosphaira vitifoliae TaxID=58002 RepID=UPI0021AA093E|nr:uncharacterized protein LOC126907152 [Daktulosphaira vitifoliae]
MYTGVKKTKTLTEVNKIRLKDQNTATETRTNLNIKSAETSEIVVNTQTTSTVNAPNNFTNTFIEKLKLTHEETQQKICNADVVLSVLADFFSEKLQMIRNIRKTDSFKATKEESKKNPILGNDKNNKSLPISKLEALKDQNAMNLLSDKSHSFASKSDVKNITNSVTTKSSSHYGTAKVNLPSNKAKFVSMTPVKIPGSKVFNGQSEHKGHTAVGVYNMAPSNQNNTNNKFVSRIPIRINVSKNKKIGKSSFKVSDLSLNTDNTSNTSNSHEVQCRRLYNSTSLYSTVKHVNTETYTKNCVKRTIKITTYY